MDILALIFKKIGAYDRIIIHRHVRPDLDAFGSQVGLAEWIRFKFPDKEVHCVGENSDSLSYLATMDVIEDQDYTDALVIICDTANSPRIDDQRYSLGKETIKIDHHPIVDQYGDINWVDTGASSTSEMIYRLIAHHTDSDSEITTDVARLLYAGIVGDTGRFLYSSTTAQTLEIASKLVKYPFDRSAIHQNIYELTPSLAKLKGYLLNQFTVNDAGVCSIKLTREILNKYQVTVEQTNALVHVYADIKGVKCWAMFVEEDHQIRVRIRSKEVTINGVAAQFNGGGHPFASGATVSNWDEADQLVHALTEVCQQ